MARAEQLIQNALLEQCFFFLKSEKIHFIIFFLVNIVDISSDLYS